MIVHLHASCWNEERMLPFFFRHYDRFVDHYFIHDNQSTDGSLAILRSHPGVTVLPLVLEGPSLVEAAFSQVNQFWHPSRGKADWVAVCNVDEFFWHFDMRWYLGKCRKKGITFLRSNGYQMVSETFPRPNDDLVQTHRFGVRDRFFDKPSFFDPDAITESGFGIARHTVEPKGRIVRPAREEIVLAHYKYLGLDYIGERHAELNSRRRALDVEAGHGAHYDAESSRRNFARLFAQRVMVLPEDQGRLSRLRRRVFRAPVRAKAPTES
jgi:hypothetical protein